MLDFFRRGSDTFIVKALFAFLFLSFIIWGFGDIFRNHSKDDAVATIGHSRITFSQYQRRYQQEVGRIQSMLGGAMPAEQLAAMRINGMVLENMINQHLFELETEGLGLRVGNDVVIDTIKNDRTFYNQKGEFDRQVFVQLLHSNNVSENDYFMLVKRGIASEFLARALLSQHVKPAVLADTLLTYRKERRNIDVLEIPLNQVSLTHLPEPTNEELVAFHDKNKVLFSVPEYRSFTYVTLGVDDVVNSIQITDEVLHSEYNDRQEQFKKPERRVVDQMLFDSEDKAKEATARLEKGDDFYAVAEELLGTKKEDTHLGDVTRNDMVKDVQDVLFALSKGSFSQPVKGPFGWYVFRVTDILPPTIQTFEQAHAELEKTLKEEKAGEELDAHVKEIEDAIASGDTLEEVAKKYHLKLRSIDSVNNQGELVNGTAVEGMPASSRFMEMIFSEEPKVVSPMTLTDDNASYFAVRVDAVQEARVRALDEMKGVAIEKWKEEKQQKELAALAEKVAADVKGGKTLEAAANELSLKLKTGETVNRPVANAMPSHTFPTALLEEVFGDKVGDTTNAYKTDKDAYVIARLSSVIPFKQEGKASGHAALLSEMEKSSENDIFEQYNMLMRKHYPVSINEKLVNRVIE